MNQTHVVDVKAWIDARPVSRFQWKVLLLCFVIIMLDGYDAAVMGFIAPALIEDWGISRSALGPILGAAMFGVAIGALVAGPLWPQTGSVVVGGTLRHFQPCCRAGAKPGTTRVDSFSDRAGAGGRYAELRHAGGGVYAGAPQGVDDHPDVQRL